MVTTFNLPTRCEFPDCRKKISFVTSVKCRCDKVYCAEHRTGYSHQCPVDVVKVHKERLFTSNPIVTSEKFQRIE
jgi:hypothetical protein